jgi:hypothetical protein
MGKKNAKKELPKSRYRRVVVKKGVRSREYCPNSEEKKKINS